MANALPVPLRTANDLVMLLRPHQWVKNVFVLFGVVFGHFAVTESILYSAALAAISFCLAASSGYIINDLIDAEKDSQHPTKRNRPIASGRVSRTQALMLHVLVFPTAILLAFAAGTNVVLAVCGYMLIQFAYTVKLKQVPILDVFCISAGFMLRIVAGTAAIGLALSQWMLLCGFTLTLFLGFVKRRAELRHAGENLRAVLRHYPPVFLDKMISLTAGLVIVSYATYTVSPETIRIHQTENLIYTVPFVAYAIARYMLVLHSTAGAGEDTAKDLFTDYHLVGSGVSWFAAVLFIIR